MSVDDRRQFSGMCRVFSLLLVSLLAVASALAQAPDPSQSSAKTGTSKIPPAQTHYLGREIAQTMHYTGAGWLTREERQKEEDCKTLVKELRIEPGMTVCDLGCGNGFYTLQLARLVGPKGKVYAVDIQAEMLRKLQARAAEEEITNIVPVLGAPWDPYLPADEVDLVLLVDVYHEFSHPQQMLRAIRRCLSKEGLIALAEFRTEDPKVPIKALHKMSKKQIMKEFPPNGLKLTRQYDKLPWQHLMFFGRDESWKHPEDEPSTAKESAN